jgi:hypothetical protein
MVAVDILMSFSLARPHVRTFPLPFLHPPSDLFVENAETRVTKDNRGIDKKQ